MVGIYNEAFGGRIDEVSKTVRSAGEEDAVDLLPNILVEILVCRNIQADAPVLEPFGLDLVRCARHSRDNNVGLCKAFLEGQRTWADNVVRVVFCLPLIRLR